jgi:alpha-ketoglutarate-dependent 2,4-dichlorophenoxyacetate dioxygenase
MLSSVRPLHPLFAAEISGIAVGGDLPPEAVAEVVAHMDRYAVCVYRHAAPPDGDAQLAFSRLLGPMEETPILKFTNRKFRLASRQMQDVSNLDENGAILPPDDIRRMRAAGNLLWHTDVSFHRIRATYSILSAHVVPPAGAATEFADLRAAYDALPEAMKAHIADLVAEHSYWHSRSLVGGLTPTAEELEKNPPAHHRVVQVHPGSGRKTLYLASHASHIVGMPIEAGRTLLAELTEFATQERFVYRHEWRIGDVVIWDNRCTMHRATPYDDAIHRRDLRRTTVREAMVA